MLVVTPRTAVSASALSRARIAAGRSSSVCDDLGQHRVVVAADDGAAGQAGVDPHAGTVGFGEVEHGTAGRQEAVSGVLRIDARLDGVPAHGDIVLCDRQLLAGRDAHLLLDKVDAGDHLGHRVLDLQPRVHLHEEELVGTVGGHDELDRARAGVVHAARRVARRRADARAGRLIEKRRRRLLDDLLVPTLQAAFALAEVHHVAVTVGEHLHLDVAGVQDESLEEQRVVAERRGGFAPRADERRGQLRCLVHHTHTLAAAARRRLDEDRIADVLGAGDQVVVGQSRPRDTGNDRHPERRHRRLRRDLVAHGLDRADRRPDEHDAGRLQRGGELRVLREESVARVDRLSAGALRRRHYGVDVEVALPRGGRSDVDRDVGLGHVARTGVGIAEHRDRSDAHRAQRADDPNGDLASVGDQNSAEFS